MMVVMCNDCEHFFDFTIAKLGEKIIYQNQNLFLQ